MAWEQGGHRGHVSPKLFCDFRYDFLLLMGTSERVMNVQVMVHLFRSFIIIFVHMHQTKNRNRNRIKNCNCILNEPYDDVRVFWKKYEIYLRCAWTILKKGYETLFDSFCKNENTRPFRNSLL